MPFTLPLCTHEYIKMQWVVGREMLTKGQHPNQERGGGGGGAWLENGVVEQSSTCSWFPSVVESSCSMWVVSMNKENSPDLGGLIGLSEALHALH